MPWDGSLLAGFTSGTPWLPLGPEHASANVAAMSKSPESLLNLYHRLIELRRGNQLLTYGAIEAVGVEGNILSYERRQGNDRLAIVLNLGHEPAQVSLPPVECCSQPIWIALERMWTRARRSARTKESLSGSASTDSFSIRPPARGK